MQNKPNFFKSQMFITSINLMNYNKKWTMDTWSNQTQTNPTCGEQAQRVEPSNPTYGERSRTIYPERVSIESGRVERVMMSKPVLSVVERVEGFLAYFGLKPLILPAVYFLQAFSKSTSFMLASVQSQASTSANSSALFFSSFDARAVASSPTSSTNHIKVAGTPLSRSRRLYFWEISC
jgi:hypothetical protein